jgi:hypothetical protein
VGIELDQSVNDIIAQVTQLTGKGFQFVHKPDMVPYAGIKIARRLMPSHILVYRVSNGGILNHMVAHECGHILRLFTVPEERRFLPVSNKRTMEAALRPMMGDIEKIHAAIGFERLQQIIQLWHTGLVRMLTNLPTDVMIERWLYDEHPALRERQHQSLIKQRNEATQGNVMNYAFFALLEEYLGCKMLGRFEGSQFADEGKALAAMTRDHAGTTHDDDVAMVKRWAEFLHLEEWFAWGAFEVIPADYVQST